MTERQYLTIWLTELPGVARVSVKLDDEGVVIDAIDEEGQVVGSTWKTYDEFGVTVTPNEDADAFAHYNDPANREPGEGPAVRKPNADM